MSLLKDWKEDNEGYRVQTRVAHFFDPREWLRLQKYRTQRADRGWSDRDMWGMGEHLAEITAEMLAELDKGHTDWPMWFDLNVREEGKGAYKSLQSVIDDINNYLNHEKTSWSDDLTCKQGKTGEFHMGWYKDGKKISEAELKNRINKWAKENNRLYKKSAKAMQFFGRHYAQFWD